jgi:uncharacterized membrane protein YgcG
MNRFFLLAVMVSGPALAQSVISAKAGVVHHVEGDVLLNDKPLVMKPSLFPEMKNRDVLRTDEGRVEILLAPGAFLRLPEKSAIRMDSNALLATRLTVLEGSALVEVGELQRDGSLELQVGEDLVTVRKAGLYRFETEPLGVRVLTGEVAVNWKDQLVKVSSGKVMSLTGDHLIAKFDVKKSDELLSWARSRSSVIAMANVNAANTLSAAGWNTSGWVFNPWFGMYTWVPGSRAFVSPFGFAFFSPVTVWAAYNPQVYAPAFGGASMAERGRIGFDPVAGYNSVISRTPGGYTNSSGAMVSNPGTGAAPVAGGERAAGMSGSGGMRGGGGGYSGGGGGGYSGGGGASSGGGGAQP